MHFGVTCHNDAEMVSVGLFYESDKVDSVVEAIFLVYPSSGPDRWVTSKSKDVADAYLLAGVQGPDDRLTGHVCAREMHEHIQTSEILKMIAQFKCDI